MSAPQFAAVPPRAIEDDRLGATHWRVLALVGRHARFQEPGEAGCYRTHQSMADQLGLRRPNFSRAISDLVSWGYLVAARDPQNNRRTRLYVCWEPVSQVIPIQGEPVSPGIPQPVSQAIPRRKAGKISRDSAEAASLAGERRPEQLEANCAMLERALKSQVTKALLMQLKEVHQSAYEAWNGGFDDPFERPYYWSQRLLEEYMYE